MELRELTIVYHALSNRAQEMDEQIHREDQPEWYMEERLHVRDVMHKFKKSIDEILYRRATRA